MEASAHIPEAEKATRNSNTALCSSPLSAYAWESSGLNRSQDPCSDQCHQMRSCQDMLRAGML